MGLRYTLHLEPRYHYNTYYGSALEIEGDEDDFEDMEDAKP